MIEFFYGYDRSRLLIDENKLTNEEYFTEILDSLDYYNGMVFISRLHKLGIEKSLRIVPNIFKIFYENDRILFLRSFNACDDIRFFIDILYEYFDLFGESLVNKILVIRFNSLLKIKDKTHLEKLLFLLPYAYVNTKYTEIDRLNIFMSRFSTYIPEIFSHISTQQLKKILFSLLKIYVLNINESDYYQEELLGEENYFDIGWFNQATDLSKKEKIKQFNRVFEFSTVNELAIESNKKIELSIINFFKYLSEETFEEFIELELVPEHILGIKSLVLSEDLDDMEL